MAGVSSDQSGLNVELNLVPFIDLLSALVLFLLLNAVWIQLSAIQATANTKGKRALAPPPADRSLQVHLGSNGYSLTWPSGMGKSTPKTLSKKSGAFDKEALKALVTPLSTKIASASVSADDVVLYGNLIETLDSLKTAGVASVAIQTN